MQWLANVNSVGKNTPKQLHMRNIYKLPRPICTLSSPPLVYHIHHPRAIFLTRKPTSSENAWIPTMNPIQSVLDARSMYWVLMLCTSLILNCITTLCYFPMANKCFLWTLEKQLDTGTGSSKKSVICMTTHRH